MYKSILEDEDADKLDEEAPAQGTLVPVHNNNNSLPNNNNISVNVENGTAGAGSNQVEPPKKRTVKNDTYFSIASQVVFPYMVAGVGMVFAGLYLHNVQVSLINLDICYGVIIGTF